MFVSKVSCGGKACPGRLSCSTLLRFPMRSADSTGNSKGPKTTFTRTFQFCTTSGMERSLRSVTFRISICRDKGTPRIRSTSLDSFCVTALFDVIFLHGPKMRFRAYILGLLFLASQAPDRAAIEGVVTRAGTTEPVPRASVVVTMVQGQLRDVETVVADDSGRFTVRNLRPGAHRVFAMKDGFVRSEHGQRAPTRPGTPVDLMAGETRRGNVVSMTPTGVIAGRVLDADGKPLRGAFVRAARAAYSSGVRELSMVQRLQTNDLGEFRFFGLEPGSYYLMALPMGAPFLDGDSYIIPSTSPPDFLGGEPDVRLTAAQALAQGAVSASAFTQEVFETTYYPGTKDQAAAIPINLNAGAVFSGIDLRVQKSTPVHVRGRVMDGTTGKPASATVSLTLPFYGTDQRNISARAIDGVFDLRVPAGSYLLNALANRSTPVSPFANDSASMR